MEKLCRLFGKTRQAYYDYTWRQSEDKMQELLIVDLVRLTRRSLPNLGTLKLLQVLKDDFIAHNICIGRDSFYELLRRSDLLIKKKRRYAITTCSQHHFRKWPDLLGSLLVNRSEQLWVSDITYLRVTNGFTYLSLITDAYSRKIVGYHLSNQLKAQGCLIALNKAIASLSKGNFPVHHSDRGIQYCCEPYVSLLQQNHIMISMTQSGSPYDNAIAERVNGILKTEFNLHNTFENYNAAVSAVHNAVDAYNRLRPHMSISNLTPEEAHKSHKNLERQWKPKQYCKVKSVLL